MTAPPAGAGQPAVLGTSSADESTGGLAWSVAGLLLAVSDALSSRFGAVTVRGELINFSRAASGHCYFTLKDAQGAAAGLRCAMFRRAAQVLDFQPTDGQQVTVRGRLAIYEARGELQMVVESMQRVGTGALYEEFLRLKAKLASLGLFDAQRKRPLPPFPRRLALVTSAAGAALHDVLSSLARRAPHVEAVLCASPVQGSEAPAALVAAMAQADALAGADLIVLCRGGGSLEDLWAFNDERVVRAIVASRLPVVCGVGHETDITLADLAADLRAPTPTAAAELATPARDDLLQDLQRRAEQMAAAMARRLDAAHQHLDRQALRSRQPGQQVAREALRLDAQAQRQARALLQATQRAGQEQQQRAERLQQAQRQGLRREADRLAATGRRLLALDPHQVLQRGYAWVENDAGRPLVSAAALAPGQSLHAVWADGRADVTVEQVRLTRPEAPG